MSWGFVVGLCTTKKLKWATLSHSISSLLCVFRFSGCCWERRIKISEISLSSYFTNWSDNCFGKFPSQTWYEVSGERLLQIIFRSQYVFLKSWLYCTRTTAFQTSGLEQQAQCCPSASVCAQFEKTHEMSITHPWGDKFHFLGGVSDTFGDPSVMC